MEPDLAPVDVERRYRALFAGMAVLAFALAGLWWLPGDGDAASHDARAVAAAPPPNLGPTSFAEVEQSAVQPESETVAGADDEIQLCGGRWVKAGPDGRPSEEALQAIGDKAFDEVAGVAMDRMTASPSPRAQAAAHYFRARRLWWLAQEGRQAELDSHRDALVRLAQTTDDAQVYAWAYQICQSAAARSPSVCMQISAAQWARMDPQNADPWLAVAQEARQSKDEAALDDAMFHVASAERHWSGFGSLAATMVEYSPQDDGTMIGTAWLVGQALAADSTGLENWMAVTDYCNAKALVESNRRETCDRVATLLTERSSTLIARNIGLAIGSRVGWSSQQLDALKERRDAESMASTLAMPADSMTCAAIRQNIDRIRTIAEFGEIELLRRDVIASGQSVSKLAETQRRWDAKVQKAVIAETASAASAAGSASAATLAQR